MHFSEFKIIGISVRTTNVDGQGIKDIGALWQRFFAENTSENIPNKIDSSIYSVYTDYEGDYMQPYTTVIGCKVDNLDNVPDTMVGVTIHEGNFEKFIAKGNIFQGSVGSKWGEIWETPLDRKYQADFEVYGEKAANPLDAEVDIFVGLN
jgi:predicted transcriptional regulator YdeE